MLLIMLLIACFWIVLSDMLHIEPANIVENHFGWLGDQNWVFGWKRVWEFVNLELPRWSFAQANYPSLKRATIMLARNWKCQFAQASAKRTLSELNPDLRHLCSLKRTGLRSSEKHPDLQHRCSLKRASRRLSEVGPEWPFSEFCFEH